MFPSPQTRSLREATDRDPVRETSCESQDFENTSTEWDLLVTPGQWSSGPRGHAQLRTTRRSMPGTYSRWRMTWYTPASSHIGACSSSGSSQTPRAGGRGARRSRTRAAAGSSATSSGWPTARQADARDCRDRRRCSRPAGGPPRNPRAIPGWSAPTASSTPPLARSCRLVKSGGWQLFGRRGGGFVGASSDRGRASSAQERVEQRAPRR